MLEFSSYGILNINFYADFYRAGIPFFRAPMPTYSVIDGWLRESLPDLINAVLSQNAGDGRDKAKSVLRGKMESLRDKNLRRNLYSICRSLKILT